MTYCSTIDKEPLKWYDKICKEHSMIIVKSRNRWCFKLEDIKKIKVNMGEK